MTTKSDGGMPLKGDVAPTDKDENPQPVYAVSYTEGKAPSNRPATHK